MARISRQVFANKRRRLGPRALLRVGYESLRARLSLSAPATNGSQDSGQHGAADRPQHGLQFGVPDGPQLGQRDGPENGFHEGGRHGHPQGVHDRNQDGQANAFTNGKSNGIQHGVQSGESHGVPLQQELGVEFHVDNGVVEPCEPGQQQPLEPVDHAADLLTWLQGQELFVGCWVPSKLLEERLYPYLASKMGWTPYAWRTIASKLVDLDGVERRQDDRRRGIHRIGPAPVVYYIPFPDRRSLVPDPDAVVVELAAAERKRG
jgi:hypothetical protein